MRRCTDTLVRRCERLAVDGFRRDRGRSNKYQGEVIRQDIDQLQLTQDMTLDRKVQRTRIRVEGQQVGVHPYQQVGVHCLVALTGRRSTILVLSYSSISVDICCFMQFDYSIIFVVVLFCYYPLFFLLFNVSCTFITSFSRLFLF